MQCPFWGLKQAHGLVQSVKVLQLQLIVTLAMTVFRGIAAMTSTCHTGE